MKACAKPSCFIYFTSSESSRYCSRECRDTKKALVEDKKVDTKNQRFLQFKKNIITTISLPFILS